MATLVDIANNISIKRTTSGPLPVVPFASIKNAVLGKKYELSVLFPNTSVAKKLHKEWKGKNSPANILSFPYDDQSGEIIMSLGQARKECFKCGYRYRDYLVFLFIHGLVHLKGHDHSDKMEALEQKYRKKFGITQPVYT